MDIACNLMGHKWSGCKCARCGITRGEGHDWSKDCERCANCGATAQDAHKWDGCKCAVCRKTRDEAHDWSKDSERCHRCGKTRDLKGALFQAASRGETGEIRTLLASGIPVGVKGTNDSTLLHVAALHNQAGAVKLLIELGADVDAKDEKGMTALMLAAESNSAEAVRVLIDSGTSLGERSKNGDTALEFAIHSGAFDSARMLAGIERSSDPSADVKDLLLPCLQFWKEEVRGMRSRLAGQNFNAIAALMVIIGIFNVLRQLADAFNSACREAEVLFPGAGHPSACSPLSFPSADGTTPEDLRWAAAHFDIAEGSIARLERWLCSLVPGLSDKGMESATGGIRVQLSGGVIVEGGPGDDADQLLVVRGAKNNRAGVLAEYEYVRRVAPASTKVELACPHFEHKGKLVDKLVATQRDGSRREFYFDITDFFGMLTAEDLLQMRRA